MKKKVDNQLYKHEPLNVDEILYNSLMIKLKKLRKANEELLKFYREKLKEIKSEKNSTNIEKPIWSK
jgi:hypothetical protein